MADTDTDTSGAVLTYHISGSVAKKRLVPLLQRRLAPHQLQEIDVAAAVAAGAAGGSSAALAAARPGFVWENTPAKSTRALREAAAVHSHVAHCAAVLEDKWALALVQDQAQRDACPSPSRDEGDEGGSGGERGGLGLLPTHCLRGKGAVAAWCAQRWGASDVHNSESNVSTSESNGSTSNGGGGEDWWVLKDAEANGAGGVWVLSRHRWRALCGVDAATFATPRSPLHQGHRYVAQRYVGGSSSGGDKGGCGCGLALWFGRKCHVRCYAVVTGDLGVWVHRRAFLHVANKPFAKGVDSEADDQVGG